MKKTFAFFLAILMLLTALTAFAEDDAPPADTPLTQLAFGQHIYIGGLEYVVSKVPYCMAGGRAVRTEENGEKTVYLIPPDPTRHSGLDIAVQTVPATCTQAGYTYRLCKACGGRFVTGELPIDPNAHTAAGAFEVITHPTCRDAGLQALRCKYCGELFSYQEMPPMSLYHRADPDADWTTVREANCVSGGLQVKYCVICGEIAERRDTPINTKAHTWAETFTVDTPATCVADGAKSRHCLYCDAKTDETVIPMEPENHAFTEYFITDTAATCREDGVQSRHCVNCGLRIDEQVIPAGDDHHVFLSEYKVLQEPTCSEYGKKAHVCVICGFTETPVLIPKTAHTFDSGRELSRSADGRSREMLYTCKLCGQTEERIEPLALPRENPDPLVIRANARCRVDEVNRLVWLVWDGYTGDQIQGYFENGWHYSLSDRDGTFKNGREPLRSGDQLVLDDGEGEAIVYTISVAGDVDANGEITARDARLALRYSARLETLTPVGARGADYSGDGVVTASDARYILRYSAELESVRHPAWTY